MKIIRRAYFTFSLAIAAAPSALSAPSVVTARIAAVGGGAGPTRTSIKNDCSAAPPRESTTWSRTRWTPASEAVGVHSTSPVTGSIVIPTGASRRENVCASSVGYGSAIDAWYRSLSPARTCVGA